MTTRARFFSIAIMLMIGVADHAAAQSITAPLFERAGLIDAVVSDVDVDEEGNVYFAGYNNPAASAWEDPLGSFDFDPGPEVLALAPDDDGQMIYVGKTNSDLELEWLKIVSFTREIRTKSLTVDADGNVTVLCAKNGFIEDVEFGEPGNSHMLHTDINGYDEIVWQVGPDGRTNWVKGFDGESYLEEIASASDGSLYILGRVYPLGADFDPGPGIARVSATNPDGVFSLNAVIVKLTSTGDFVWVGHFPGSEATQIWYCMSVGPDDGVYIAASFEEQVDVDPRPDFTNYLEETRTYDSAFIVRLNADGDLVWARESAWESPAELLVDDTGGALLLSRYTRLERFSPNGTLLWSDIDIGSSDYHQIADIALGRNGDFYVYGAYGTYFYLDAPAPDRSYLQPDGWYVARCNLDKTHVWTTQYLDIGDQNYYGNGTPPQIFHTDDNALILVGTGVRSVDADPSPHASVPLVPYNDNDFYFIKYRSADAAWLDVDTVTLRQKDGTLDFPLGTLAGTMRAIQPGQPIHIVNAGTDTTSREIGTFSKQTRIDVVGNPVRIGVQP